jgi:LIVCS family branched-chain amino acid:cation transporter
MEQLTRKQIVLLSFMLFSMFFGAGNLIFPPYLGYAAGEHVWYSLSGFVLSAVGLPILGVVSVARAGSFHALANRVHPVFAFFFPLVIYLCIGPGLGIPRAGSLAYEMGIQPFLPKTWSGSSLSLLLYTLFFFSLVLWLSLTPSKLVDRFGKLLTPLLLALIGLIFVKSLLTPLGKFGEATGTYVTIPAFQGFLDGYLTMDALASLVFGITVANTLRAKGVVSDKGIATHMMYAGVGAGLLLTVIYLILGYLGAASSTLMGKAENGAQILTMMMGKLFGQYGNLLLGFVFTIACLCVSIGLVTSCSQFFASQFPRIPYKVWAVLLSAASFLIANLGLTQILKISVPILGAIYPISMILILLTLINRSMHARPYVYRATVLLVGLYSILDTINQVWLGKAWSSWLSLLPLYADGVGWLLPALVGWVIGTCMTLFTRKKCGERTSTVLDSAK